MPISIRLNEKEQELIRKKCIEINKKLVEKEKAPVRESELIHLVLEQSIQFAMVDKKGNLTIDI